MRHARAALALVGAAIVLLALLWLGVGVRPSSHTSVLAFITAFGFVLTVGSLLATLREAQRFAGRVASLTQLIQDVIDGKRSQLEKLPTGSDEIAALADCFRALTAEIQTQITALERARERAEIASTAKSSFLANMSHELRTPLNAIIGYAELVAEELQDHEHELGGLDADIERIQLSARHLLGLINDILDISKIEAGEVRVEVRPVDFGRIVKDVRASTELLIRKGGNSFELAIEPELGVLDSDSHKIRQILINLLGNAAKFTDDGSVTLTIAREGDEHVRFAVSDTGIGIAPHKLEILFEPFVQADASSSRRFGGTGLGLTISRHFTQMLGGQLNATSEPGRGSTFTFTLPRTRRLPSQSA